MVHRLARQDARRLAVRAQLLDAERPSLVVEVVEALTLLNIDPVNAIAPSEDHLLWTRLGIGYEHAHLQQAVEVDRTVFEWDGSYRPALDLPLLLAVMRQPPRAARVREWLEANEGFRRDVLALLADAGPLPSSQIPDTAQRPWGSSGWNNNRNVTMLLEFLARLGVVAISRRTGRERWWDLAERVYPSGLPELEIDEAERLRAEATGHRDDSDAYAAALRGCRQSLSPRDAALVKMRYEKGLSFEEIAKLQNQTPEAVQRMISRIRFRLRDCIQTKLGDT